MKPNSDTINKIEEIRSKRWYEKGTTLGEGGWGQVNRFAMDWMTYQLLLPGGEIFEFHAENDQVALAACKEKFTLKKYSLLEKIVKLRKVVQGS